MSDLTHAVTQILAKAGVPDFAAEADRIVRAARSSASLDTGASAHAMAQRRACGEPLAYVIGREIFMGIELIAAQGALVPREETELLGYAALQALRACPATQPRLIDMCCGSGNLACALASHLAHIQVWASDLTEDCVAVTRRNVALLGVFDQVKVIQSDLFQGLHGQGLEGTIDIIVCNPPYISQGKLAGEASSLTLHEPLQAFDGGPYGLSIHQRIIKDALPFLRLGGELLVEIGLGQDRQVKMLFERAKEYDDLQMLPNAKGQIRVITGKKMKKSSL